MGGQAVLREDKGSEEARASGTRCVKIRRASHSMEGICWDENRVGWLEATWHSRKISTTPVVVPLQGLVVYVCGSYRLGAAVDIVLQVITLVCIVGCRWDQAKVHFDGH